jgi:hypothetical protein
MTPSEFISQFTFGGLLAIAIGDVRNRQYINATALETLEYPLDKDVYFGPAMLKTAGGEKTDVLGTRVLWVDVDDASKPQCTLPPSMTVFSGHGWHLYWILTEPLLDFDKIEALNKLLAEDVPTADRACWNGNRVLRIPSTTNLKDPLVPVTVELKSFRPSITYTPADFAVAGKLSRADRHKITTGDKRGYRSRSERDWAILTALMVAGATDDLIRRIFAEQACGDKSRENDHYLEHTLETLRDKNIEPDPETEIQEREDGYYVPFRKGVKRISTFLFDPMYLLDGSPFKSPDAVVGDVSAEGYVWNDVTFSRAAFTSVSKLDKETPVAAWQFLGRDDELRRLLPYFLQKLRAKGLPKVAATPVMGLHKISGDWRFLGDRQTLGDLQLWSQFMGPICWLPSQREHPEMDLDLEVTPEERQLVAESLPKLNEPGVIWPMIGWYTATCLKPWFETKNYRFPVLNVAGTKGSGKTSLIQRVFMPLMGQKDPKTYDANTTRFVILSLLGSTNAIPIAFSEFRFGSVENFIRFILLSYDTGHDPRGRGDQTTVDYPLSAPFSVDGEDLIEDPAARERVVVAQMHPATVEEGGEAYTTFQHLRNNMPKHFGGYMIQEILKRASTLENFLAKSREAVFAAFPSKLPDRVRNNHVVAYMGVLLWCDILKVTPPEALVMEKSIVSVFNLVSGRARTLADSMVEDLVNGIIQGAAHLNYVYDNDTNIIWFQLAPAHSWWIMSRRRQGRGSLERDAIRAQLKEAPYSVEPRAMNDAWMYGVDLNKAVENGLDVPTRIADRSFVIRM